MFSGAQFSIHAMSDNFVDVILGGVRALGSPDDLRLETDDISTLVVGTPQRVFEAMQSAYAESCRLGGHVVLQAHISRGCPGEPDDPLCSPQAAGGSESATANSAGGNAPAAAGEASSADTPNAAGAGHAGATAPAAVADPRSVDPIGIPVAAQFSLYPMGTDLYMEVIAGEIEQMKMSGVFDRSKHFCTKLRGDLATVMAAVRGSFERAAEHAGHVVIQLTVSKGSPSEDA